MPGPPGLARRLSFTFCWAASLNARGAIPPACPVPPSIPLHTGTALTARDALGRGEWYLAHKLNDCAADSFQLAARTDRADAATRLAAAAALDGLGRRKEAEAAWRFAWSMATQAGDPDDAGTALDHLSSDLLADKDFLGVVSLLNALPKDPSLSLPQTLNLGEALALLSRLNEALQVLKEGLARFPGSEIIANQIATVQMLAGQHEEAYATLEATLKSHAGDWSGKQATETLYLRSLISGRSEKATAWADKMVLKYPADAKILYLAADLAWKMGNETRAQDLVKRSLARDAGDAGAQQLYGTLLAQAGELAGAREHLERAIALGDPEPDVRYRLARVQTRLGDAAAARRTLEAYRDSKAADQARIDTAEDVNHGDSALRDGDATGAAALYRRALELSPNEALIHYKLSRAQDQMHDLAGERAELQTVLALDSSFAEALNQMGYLSLHEGDAQDAETYFLAATRNYPTYLVAWNNLAATYASEAKWKEANEAADQALRIDGTNDMSLKIKASIARSQSKP